MSNTIVTNYSNVSGKSTNADKSLVIIVNKDGSVSLEKDAIQSLLESQYENATVSIVRMNDDGKPDDASDHSSDESVPHINLTVDAFFDSVTNEKDSQSEYVSDLFGSEISLIGFQNDHCYTPLTSPSQSRRNSECDSNLFKEETGSYSPSLHKQYIPNSKKITVLENKIIAKGKNVQYYNSSGGREVLKGSDIVKRPGSQSTQLIKRVDIDKVQLKSLDHENVVLYKLHDNFSDNEVLNDAEQNLDSDYLNIDGTNKDGNLRAKSLLKKDVKKILSRKIELKNNGLLSTVPQMVEHDQNLTNRNRKTSKSYNVQKIVDEKMKNSLLKMDISKGSDNVRQPLLLNTKLSDSDSSRDLGKSDPKLDAQRNQKSVLKKDKKPSSHNTALLNDMTSLFQSPDVIRRVSTDSKPPKTPDKIINSLLKKSDQPTLYLNVTDKIGVDTMHISKITSPKPDQRSYTNTNTTKVVTKSMSDISTRRHKNQKEGLDVMSPFDEVSLAQLLQETNSGMLSPDPMVLGPVTVQTPLLDKHDPNALSVTNSVLMSPNSLSSGGLNAPLSPSLDLLGGLHPEEEGLSEDLLRHVAQLVESSENLQEVIDKQVLGKVNNIAPKQIQPLLAKIEHNIPQQIMPEIEKAPVNVNIVKKEPIQIVRSNGRVIILPPIEAPATRSSKRKSMMNTSGEINPGVSSPDVSKLIPQPPTPVKQPVQTYSRSHRASESKSVSQVQNDKKDDDAESDESWNSEDDPDRLWCICKQPHNNRFMICCDSCEDWFHGKCVNVTKAMGQEMEDRGIEWRCPNCVKKKGHANPSFKSLLLRKSTEGKADERPSRLSTDGAGSQFDSSTSCIVCKKPARTSSIFCSDACILKHAQDSINIASPPAPTNAKNVRDAASNKPRPETRVIVYERKTGKILAGTSAPTTSNLKTWLQEHPTYEVVQPGTSVSKPTMNMSKSKPKQNSPKVQSVLTLGPDNVKMSFSSPGSKTVSLNKSSPKSVTQYPATAIKSPTLLNRPQTPKIPLKSPPTPKTPAPVQKKRDDSLTPQRFGNNTEPIRDNVKKTLRDEISKRMLESKDVKFTHEEIHKFSVDTEYELHDLFKDVGAKYKAKYRSLMFNLKDRKNLTLWQKICDRSITPKQLVRLSPEELASQELAQWRDKEVKHQLELIKKSELDLLSCNKTYVLKTHKGEEVMESRTTGTAELDPNVPMEDLVSVLNKSVDVGGESTEGGSRQTSPVTTLRDDRHSSHHKHYRHKSKSSKSSKSNSKNDNSTTKRERSSSKHRSSKDSRSDNRSHHRRSSRDRDRKSSSSRRHSDSSRISSHSKSTSKTDDEKKQSVDLQIPKDLDCKKDEFKMDLIGLENIRSPVLYDCKPDDLNEIGNDLMSPNSNSPKSPVTPDLSTNQKFIGCTESDQEPSSTMDSMVWNGTINMVDVARFSVSAQEVSGQSEDIIQELESEFDVVGRISPDTVWDYISKMKKQGYNDILILRFSSTSDEEKIQYMALYNYLSSRSRLGVIRVRNGGIKDFYILPLASHLPLPPVLLPVQGPGFEEMRPHLLLGIIVKQRRKRASHLTSLSAVPSKIAKHGHSSDRSYTPPTENSYTPPSSPKRKIPSLSTSAVISGMPLPSFLPNLSPTVRDKIAATLASADDDEPYSPGGSDSGSLERSRSPTLKQPLAEDHLLTPDDLQRKMDELTRKIEEEKKQIENMGVNISGDSLDEPYSPSRPMSPSASGNPLPELSSISLPSNLQEILASIQKKIQGPTNDLTDSQSSTEAYVPQPILSSSIASVNSPYYKEGFSGDVDMRMINTPVFPTFAKNKMDVTNKGTSKLSTLSEAELLSMVPDDEILLPSNKSSVYPPLPSVPPPPMTDTSVPPPPFKRQKLDYGQPPPPGYEG
ncbi:protein partner of snf isoform X2 [Arctopsyche grandis]|uniref:protein partner of snf isoform X2 n=1 Tax=Arctopsyche grandis TaxID=121162 RepID=UPI00406D9B7C